MEVAVLTHAQLMRESERRVERAVESRNPLESIAAGRLLADGTALRLWEIEHARYMRVVACERRRPGQLSALRWISFGLIHRKALFEYLRAQAPRGHERRRVVSLCHRSLAYSDAIIAEHRAFIRSTCSNLCANYIATSLFEEPTFENAFREYERLFAEYFALFCSARVAGTEAADPCHALLPYLKHAVNEQRRLIIAGPAALAAAHRARERLLRPSGDTETLPAFR
jgi:hypothetical protein